VLCEGALLHPIVYRVGLKEIPSALSSTLLPQLAGTAQFITHTITHVGKEKTR
jgi:hypothetical protein